MLVTKHFLNVYREPHFSHITYFSNVSLDSPKYFFIMYNDVGNEIIKAVVPNIFCAKIEKI